MANWTLSYLDYRDFGGNDRRVLALVSDDATPQYIVLNAMSLKDGNPVDETHPFPIKIKTDDAGSLVETDDESVARGQSNLAAAIAMLYAADGTAPSANARKIAYVFGGGLQVGEGAAKGAASATTVTVDSTTDNGVQLIAANSTGTRRRVIITQRGTTAVEVKPGSITKATGKARYLAGTPGLEQVWFIAGELRATVASGSQEVSVTEEVHGN